MRNALWSLKTCRDYGKPPFTYVERVFLTPPISKNIVFLLPVFWPMIVSATVNWLFKAIVITVLVQRELDKSHIELREWSRSTGSGFSEASGRGSEISSGWGDSIGTLSPLNDLHQLVRRRFSESGSFNEGAILSVGGSVATAGKETRSGTSNYTYQYWYDAVGKRKGIWHSPWRYEVH